MTSTPAPAGSNNPDKVIDGDVVETGIEDVIAAARRISRRVRDERDFVAKRLVELDAEEAEATENLRIAAAVTTEHYGETRSQLTDRFDTLDRIASRPAAPAAPGQPVSAPAPMPVAQPSQPVPAHAPAAPMSPAGPAASIPAPAVYHGANHGRRYSFKELPLANKIGVIATAIFALFVGLLIALPSASLWGFVHASGLRIAFQIIWCIAVVGFIVTASLALSRRVFFNSRA